MKGATMTERKGKSGTIDVNALLAGDEEFLRALVRTAFIAGKDSDGHGYVLADLSGRYSPADWAQRAIAAYRTH
jgi:hypothetical protein